MLVLKRLIKTVLLSTPIADDKDKNGLYNPSICSAVNGL